jgi:hypothetical protein
MIWQASRFTAKNGLLTDLVVASTAFSKHEKGQGQSQATIMFIFSPKADCAVFERSWLGLLDLNTADKTTELLRAKSRNYKRYDDKTNMRKEATLFSDSNGCYALVYNGIEGPYQANRINYLDFVRSFPR